MVRTLVRSLGLAFLLGISGCAPSTVTRENFDRIELGMPRAEVEKILGPPHGSYQGILSWRTDHSQKIITVVLDNRGQVSEKNADGL
jgi:hypothetical protein